MNFEMKITTVVSKDIIRKEIFVNNKIQMINFIVVALALITGTLLYMFAEENIKIEINNYFMKYSLDFASKTKIEIFSGIFISHLPYIVIMIIFSTSTIGYVFAILVSFSKVMGLGIVSAYLYSSFALKGIEYAFMIFFPGKFILLFSVLCIMYFSVSKSYSIHKLAIGEHSNKTDGNIFAVNISFSTLLFVITALIECFFISSFCSLFTF